jgi:hypothetical protein
MVAFEVKIMEKPMFGSKFVDAVALVLIFALLGVLLAGGF